METIEAVKNTVKWWCTYSKREFQTADSFDGIVSEDSRLLDILVLDGTCLNTRDNIKAVSDAAEKGVKCYSFRTAGCRGN